MTTCLGKGCSFGFTVRVFRGHLSDFFVFFPSFPFGIENRNSDVIVLIPDHCLSIYFVDHFQDQDMVG